MKKLEKTKSIHKNIHKILIQSWDPIGIGNFPEAQDEYDMYIPTIYELLVKKKNKHELLNYLWWLETERMGLAGDRQRIKKIIGELLELMNEKIKMGV